MPFSYPSSGVRSSLGVPGSDLGESTSSPPAIAHTLSPASTHQPNSDDSDSLSDAQQLAIDTVENRSDDACSCQRESVSRLRAAPPAQRAAKIAKHPRKLHRIAAVRGQQNISQRTIARRMGIEVRRLREIENEHSDITISELISVQQALDVPLIDLLEDCSTLSRPVEERAKLIKIMKTAVALRGMKCNPRLERMIIMLCEQLVDLMPELSEVSGWPQFGTRRGTSALGKALENPISLNSIAEAE